MPLNNCVAGNVFCAEVVPNNFALLVLSILAILALANAVALAMAGAVVCALLLYIIAAIQIPALQKIGLVNGMAGKVFAVAVHSVAVLALSAIFTTSLNVCACINPGRNKRKIVFFIQLFFAVPPGGSTVINVSIRIAAVCCCYGRAVHGLPGIGRNG